MPFNEQAQEILESLRGFIINEDTIELLVTSNGCTDKESFVINVNTGFTGLSPTEITVFRKAPDTCKMMPRVVSVIFTKKELGINDLFEVTLTNKFGNMPAKDLTSA